MVACTWATSACSDNGEYPTAPTNNTEFCDDLYREGLSPAEWDQDRFMRDCEEGLASGFTRDQTRAIYEEMAENGDEDGLEGDEITEMMDE